MITTLDKKLSIPTPRISTVFDFSFLEENEPSEINEILFVTELECECCCHDCYSDYFETETYLFEHFW